jgi:hypothetical protein
MFWIGTPLLGLVALVCAILVIYDVVAVNKKLSDGEKVIWIIAAIIFSIITAIVYYLVKKRK